MRQVDSKRMPKNFSWRSVDLLQKLPQEYRWAFNDRETLISICLGTKTRRSKKLAILKPMIKFGKLLGIEWQLIYIVGLSVMLKMFIAQLFATNLKRKTTKDNPDAFFVALGVNRNDKLYCDYCRKVSGVVGRLDQYNIRSFIAWYNVNFQTGMYFLGYSTTLAKNSIAAIPPELIDRENDFLLHIVSKLGYYAFMRSWFHTVRRTNPCLKEIAFSCQNMASFAAVDEGFYTIYFSHGALGYAELLPAFNEAKVISNAEMEFAKSRLPDLSVSTYKNQIKKLNPSQMFREVLIFSYPTSGNKYMENIGIFLDFAKNENITIKVRLHPSDNDNEFWHKYQEAGLVSIESCDISANDALARLKPRLTLSWGSTTLIDALDNGIIPINASDGNDFGDYEMVYPANKRSLSLDCHFKLFSKLFHDNDYYNYVLAKLYSNEAQDIVSSIT
ncbi:hypothetical protein OAB05_01000 [Amylibacter sp.]|nr:hypothetical protein [Amylibacter sp.]